MESNTNINPNETRETEAIDETVDPSEEFKANEAAQAHEFDATEADGRPRGRGRGRGHRGPGGRRPFGPNRPYRFALFVEDDGSFMLRSPDLSERSAKIESLDELGATLQAAIAERAAEDVAAAADAEKDAEYSGKFVLRLPRSMHRQLAELAETEGVSLNHLALGFLAEGLGRAETIQEFSERRGKHRGPRGGRGPGGRGPWDRGPRGDRERGPEGHGPEHDFGGRPDCKARGHRGPHGSTQERRGFHQHGRFMGEGPAANAVPDGAETNDISFV
jgi:antitoxin HicB